MDPIDAAIAKMNAAVLPPARFNIFSEMLTAELGMDGKRRLKGVASSTTRDLHGDIVEESALQDMERDAGNNLTIFLNHSYQVPEDVAGSVEVAKMTRRGADQDGNPNWDLDFGILIEDDNPRAVGSWQAIKNGRKLGLSIGALIPEGGAVRDKKTGTWTIQHILLLETSIVGLPANTRSWITGATKALTKALFEKAQTHQLGSPTLTLDGERYHIEGSLEGLSIQNELHVQSNSSPATAAATCPDCGGTTGAPKGNCKNPMHNGKSIEDPPVQDARIRIIEVDTDDSQSSDGSSQGAGDSEPDGDDEFSDSATPSGDGAAGASDPVAIAAALEAQLAPTVRASMQMVLRQLEATTRELVATREALSQEQGSRKAAERSRDAAIAAATELSAQTRLIVERLADTPMGRKSSFQKTAADFSHLEGIYSGQFLALLRTT